MTRMFVAAYPPPDAVEDLDAFLDVRRDAADFRWTLAEHWHLTLAFLDDVPDRAQDELIERLDRAAAKRPAMTTTVAGGGAFPGAHHANLHVRRWYCDNSALDGFCHGLMRHARVRHAPRYTGFRLARNARTPSS